MSIDCYQLTLYACEPEGKNNNGFNIVKAPKTALLYVIF